MHLQLLVRQYPRMIGLARYAQSLQAALTALGVHYSLVEPAHPLPLRAAHRLFYPLGYDVRTFFTNYPVAAAGLQPDAVKHFTAQMMASLLAFRPPLRRVVITVHDIVPYLVRDDPDQNVLTHFYDRLMDNLAMQNLRRADRLIAVSAYTKKMLIEKLGCSADKIQIVLYGLDHERFKPVQVADEFRSRYQLDPKYKYLLYVGSENPRKNLSRLVEAIAQVKTRLPNIRLLKIGTPEYKEHYHLLKKKIHDLGLEETVIFYEHPPQADLVAFYSVADGFVYPSLYEGFGMPPLEAMACGTPVICSNSASLPEVVGDAGLLVDPHDVSAISSAMLRLLADPDLARDLRERGLERARQFTWERAARQTLAVYHQVLDGYSH